MTAAAVSWQTRQGETVTIGDLVALSGLANRNAKGLIVGVTAE
jgi:cell shape-determining protein MreC